MDYQKLVKAAGYKGDQADFIARKLESRKVPAHKLNELHGYFPRVVVLAGVDLSELGFALYGAAKELEATDAAKELAEKEKVDLAKVQGSGKSGRVTKADVEAATEN